MVLLQSLIIALSMYSKIPMPRIEWTKENTRHVMCFFPVVGVITGLCAWVVGTLLLEKGCGRKGWSINMEEMYIHMRE